MANQRPWNDGVFGPGGCDGVPGFVQGDYGAPGNFEVVVSNGGQLQHLWRDGAGWHEAPRFGGGILRAGPSLVHESPDGAWAAERRAAACRVYTRAALTGPASAAGLHDVTWRMPARRTSSGLS